jgi:hypothetical protein
MILMLILTYRRLISSLVISGLKELKILKATSLNQVFDEANWQEEYFFHG